MRNAKMSAFIISAALIGAACILGGCGRETNEETELISVEEADKKKAFRENSGGDAGETSGREEEGGDISDTADTMLFVDVCGEVKRPGVYEFEPGSRVYEAIERAGGMTDDAAGSCLNQAEKLADGQQVYVPSEDEAKEGRMIQEMPGASSQQDGRVNLNTASKEELMTLSGIGEVKAESIIKFREEQGGFRSAEDIMKIEGIKEGVYNKIKDQIKI